MTPAKNLLIPGDFVPPFTFPSVIDNTTRKDFAACNYKAMLARFYHLDNISPSIHLHFGACFARGLEVTRRAYYSGELSADEAVLAGRAAITASWGEYDEEGNGTVKSLPRCRDALESYFLEYPLHSDYIKPMMTSEGKPAVEFSFALPLPINHPDTGEPLLYAGRFDMIGMFNDTLYAVDEKTTTSLGASWGKQWDLASQFSGYCYAAREYGYPVGGAIVRGIGLLKTSTTFTQHISMRPNWLLSQWYEQLLRDIEGMIYSYKQEYFNKSFGDACSAYGDCPFKTLCTTNTPENWLSGYYTERHWNPLDKGA